MSHKLWLVMFYFSLHWTNFLVTDKGNVSVFDFLSEKKIFNYYEDYANFDDDIIINPDLEFTTVCLKKDNQTGIFGTKNGSLNVLSI